MVRGVGSRIAAAQLAGASGSIVGRIDTKLVIPQLIVRDPLEALQTIGRRMRENFPGPVVGVTGSAGKTSTKDLSAAVLGTTFLTHASPASFNNEIGVPMTMSSAPVWRQSSTPKAASSAM